MLYRRSRGISAVEDKTGIPISPLIDCVFLLLIFFLVTTMLKRKETIIPVIMPDAASSLAETAREEVMIIGLDAEGRFLVPAGRDRYGALTYREGGDLATYLDGVISREGSAVLTRSLRIDVARDTPFQKTIDALDRAKLRGFDNVSVKLHQPFEE